MVDILLISDPTELFPDENNISRTFRNLVKRYHPDACGGSEKEMLKLQDLYQAAKELKRSGRYIKKNSIIFTDFSSEEKITTNIDFQTSWCLGTIYKTNNGLFYSVNKMEDHLSVLKHFLEYGDVFFKHPSFPKDVKIGKILTTNEEDYYAILINNVSNHLVNMKTFISERGNIEKYEEYVYWITTKLYELSCVFEDLKISHNGIIPENIFLDLHYQNVYLFGGWGFSTIYGSNLKFIPSSLLYLLTEEQKINKKIKSHEFVSKSIKHTMRLLLGDLSCSSLVANNDIHHLVKQWILEDKSFDSAKREYDSWSVIYDTISNHQTRKSNKKETLVRKPKTIEKLKLYGNYEFYFVSEEDIHSYYRTPHSIFIKEIVETKKGGHYYKAHMDFGYQIEFTIDDILMSEDDNIDDFFDGVDHVPFCTRKELLLVTMYDYKTEEEVYSLALISDQNENSVIIDFFGKSKMLFSDREELEKYFEDYYFTEPEVINALYNYDHSKNMSLCIKTEDFLKLIYEKWRIFWKRNKREIEILKIEPFSNFEY